MCGHLLFLVVIVILSSVSVTSGDNSVQCKHWGHVAANSTVNESGLQMNCQKNSSCTGIECSGNYHYSIARYAQRDVDFCFGFRLNPCYTPVTADVYLQVNEKHVSYVGRFHSMENVQVPGLTYKIVNHVVTADVFLEVTMGTVANGSVLFGVDLTVRADYTVGQAWPEGLKRSLVPKQYLFVRSCTSSLSAPPDLVPGACIQTSPTTTGATAASTKAPRPTKPGETTPKPPPQTTTAAAAKTTTAAVGKACDDGILFSCGPNEYCEDSVCKCYDVNQDDKGECQEYSTSAPPPTRKPVPSAQQDDSKPNTTLIASSVVGGVVGILLIVVVALIVVRWRRSRSRYSNHELLLNNDDDNMVM